MVALSTATESGSSEAAVAAATGEKASSGRTDDSSSAADPMDMFAAVPVSPKDKYTPPQPPAPAPILAPAAPLALGCAEAAEPVVVAFPVSAYPSPIAARKAMARIAAQKQAHTRAKEQEQVQERARAQALAEADAQAQLEKQVRMIQTSKVEQQSQFQLQAQVKVQQQPQQPGNRWLRSMFSQDSLGCGGAESKLRAAWRRFVSPDFVRAIDRSA